MIYIPEGDAHPFVEVLGRLQAERRAGGELPRILQVSKGFNYTWDGAKPYGDHVVADRMSLNGQRIDPAASYRVTVNNYLSAGGDGFVVLKDGVAPQFGVYDVDALYGYFQANSPIAAAAADRIARIN